MNTNSEAIRPADSAAHTGCILSTQAGLLQVQVFSSRAAMGAAAGKDVVQRINRLLQQQQTVRIVFAAAPSQAELLACLVGDGSIDWSRVEAFHMDEYIGLPPGAPQRFSRFLMEHLFGKVKPGRVHLIDDSEGIEAACEAYTALIKQAPIDIVCLGIGENGHIAFNDPPVADFNDPHIIKPVVLDRACKQQQVNDGCFASIGAVPVQALTLTIPALLSGRYLYCVVPGPTKSEAVKNTLTGPVTTACPASVLRTHPQCCLYLDSAAYSQLL